MSLNLMLELVTRGQGLFSNLAPLMHENSKIWPYQRASPDCSAPEEMLPAHKLLAHSQIGIDLKALCTLPFQRAEKPPSPAESRDVYRENSIPVRKIAELLVSSVASLTEEATEFARDAGPRLYLLAPDVEGLAPGSYFYWPADAKLILVRPLANRFFEEQIAVNPNRIRGSAGFIVICGVIRYDGQLGGERRYRNLLLAAGCLVRGVVNGAVTRGLAADIVVQYFDDPLAVTVGVDPNYEQPLIMIALRPKR